MIKYPTFSFPDPKTRQIVQRKYMSSMVSKSFILIPSFHFYFANLCCFACIRLVNFRKNIKTFLKLSLCLIFLINHNIKLAFITKTTAPAMSHCSHWILSIPPHFHLQLSPLSMNKYFNSSFLFLSISYLFCICRCVIHLFCILFQCRQKTIRQNE